MPVASSKNHYFLAGVVENTEWSHQVSFVVLIFILFIDFTLVFLLNHGKLICFCHRIPEVSWNTAHYLSLNFFFGLYGEICVSYFIFPSLKKLRRLGPTLFRMHNVLVHLVWMVDAEYSVYIYCCILLRNSCVNHCSNGTASLLFFGLFVAVNF